MSRTFDAIRNTIGKEWPQISAWAWAGFVCLGLALMFLAGVSALATDYVWDGDGPVTEIDPPGPWVNPANWVINSGYPENANDNVALEDVSPSPTCTYNPPSAKTVNNVVITGSSPTKMKLHVTDYALTIEGDLSLNDYSELDIDQNLTVSAGGYTAVVGDVRFDLASDKTFTARDMVIGGGSTTVDFTTGSGSAFEAESIKIDANAANAQRAFKLDGGPGTLTLSDADGQILVKSDLDTDNQRAKLWIAAGTTVGWECGGVIDIIGGTSSARRVEIDIDENFDATTGDEVVTNITGYVDIDIAAGKTINTGQLKLTGPNTRLSVQTGDQIASLITEVPMGGCN